MKPNVNSFSLLNALITAAIAVCGIGCLVTGFSLELDAAAWLVIPVILTLFALLSQFCFSRRLGWLPLVVIAVLCLLLGQALPSSVERLLYLITRRYNSAYGWGYVCWSGSIVHTAPLAPPLILLGLLVTVPISWVFCRRKWVGFGLIPGMIPLFLCCVVTDTVPNVIFLLPLAAGLLLLLMTQLARRLNESQRSRITAALMVPVLLFTLLSAALCMGDAHATQAQTLQNTLLELLERFSGPFTSDDHGIISLPSAPAATLDLQNVGPRNPGTNTVLTVQADHAGLFYLRGQSYDTYTGTAWESNLDTTDEGGWPTITGTETKNATISFIAHLDLRYFPYYVQEENWTAQLKDGAYQNPRRRSTYPFTWASPDEGAAVSVSPLSGDARDAYTDLPQDTQEAAETILETLFKGNTYTQAEQVQLIADYVRASASYNTNTRAMPNGADDFAIWFLKQGDTGYCVHFASAAAVLLRAAGIPARYISGYIAYTLPGYKSTVTADQAHAWVEYLDEETGWTVLDATPGAGDLAQPPETTAPTETTVPPEETTAPTETMRPTENTTAPTETTRVQNTVQPTQPQEQQKPTLDLSWLPPILWTLLILALLFIQFGIRQKLRLRWLNKGDPNKQALRRWKYARYLSRLTRQKMPEELTALAEKAAYSQHELTKKELRAFDLWIREAQAKFLKRPWPVKLLFKILFAM